MAHTSHSDHAHHLHYGSEAAPPTGLRRLAFQATLHCMTGCAIGEIAGLVIGTALGLGTWQTVALAERYPSTFSAQM